MERGTYRGGRGGRGGSHLNPRKTPEQIESSTSKLPTAAVESTTAPTDPTPTPTGPAQTRTTFAARGNRLPTGGIQKPKLTEEELSAKLAAAKLNNAKREEAHRVAEADAASFQRREELAREKRKEEGVARRVMEGEREKNRQRKLAGRGGREWDEGKEEVQDKESGRGSNFRRGMHGGVGPRGGSGRGGFGYQNSGEGNVIEEGEGRGRGRGRNRGRGGRGRGDTGDAKTGGKAASFVAEDFPALEPKKTETPAKGEENVKSPVEEKGSWAEQMNSAGT